MTALALRLLPARLARLLASGAAIAASGLYVGAGLQFVLQLLSARLLGLEHFGHLSIALSVVVIGAMAGQLGFSHGIVRLIGTYSENGDLPRLRGALRAATALCAVAGLALAGLGWAGLALWPPQAPVLADCLFWAFVTLPPAILLRLGQNMARGFDRHALANFPDAAGVPAVTLAVALIGYGQPWLTAPALMAANAAAYAGLTVLVYLRLHAVPEIRGLKPWAARYDLAKWLAMSLRLLLSVAANQILTRVDILLLGALLPGQVVGAYALAARFAQVLAVTQMAVVRVWAAPMARAFAGGDVVRLQRIARKAARGTFVLSAAIAGAMLAAAPLVLSTVAEETGLVFELMLVLLIGRLAATFFAPSVTLLQMTRYEREVNGIFLAVLLASLPAYWLGIPVFGAVGAACITALAALLPACLAAWYGKIRLGCYTGAVG